MFVRIWTEAKMLKVDCGLTWPWNRTRRHQQGLYPVIWWSTSRNQVLKKRVPLKQALVMTREDIQILLVSKKNINDMTWQAHCAYWSNHSCNIDWSFRPSCWTCFSRHVFGYPVMDKLKEYMVYLPQECPVWLTASMGSTFETVSFSTPTVAQAIVQLKKSRRLTGVLFCGDNKPWCNRSKWINIPSDQGVDSNHLDQCNRFLSTTRAIFLKILVFRGSTHSLVKQSRHPRLLEANPKLWNNLGCPFYCGFNWISLFLPLFPLSLS